MDTNQSEAGGILAHITEVLLRRHGPEKLNVVDVTRALKMSHGNAR